MSDFVPRAPSAPALYDVGFIEHDDAAFRRAFNLFQLPHQELSCAAAASVEWAFLEFTDHNAHRPSKWPSGPDDVLDPTHNMNAAEYLGELTALLDQLIAESTHLVSRLRYHRARAELPPQPRTRADRLGAS